MKPLLAAALTIALTGCATVQHGPVQKIHVDSEPQDALVKTSDCGIGSTKEVRTPGVVWVSRRADKCTLRFSAPGHYTETVTLHREVADEFLQNVNVVGELCCWDTDNSLTGLLLGGLFAGTGFAVDGATGAMFKQEPSALLIELEPVEP
jgi:hypothetical protein